jgi:hypothetical protein
MATDVVGFSRLIQSDEARTLAALGGIRELTENQIKHIEAVFSIQPATAYSRNSEVLWRLLVVQWPYKKH